jgi:chemotaxis protein MotB
MKRLFGFLILMFLFITLIAGCSSNKMIAEKDREIDQLRAELKELRGEKEQTDRLSDELNNSLAQLEAEKSLRIEGNRIIMSNAVLFSSGSVTISDLGKKILDDIWNILTKYPDRDIFIEGHTDNVPIAQKYQGKYKSNWELSCARSLAVLHYVRAKKNANFSRIVAVGYGEYRPIANNSSEEGRKQNRRVVIAIGRMD